MPESQSRVQRYEKKTEIPLLLIATAFLVAYAWPVLDQKMSYDVRTTLFVVSWTVWGVFVIDYAVRVTLAGDQLRAYVWAHWYDVPMIALPVLRPLRVLRLLAFVRMLNRSATGGLVERATVYIVGVAIMAIGLGAVAVLDVEQNAPGANITSFGDALWWAASTVFTVGYGDRYPVTTEGRLIAVALMVVGIGVVGAITASIATWMVTQVRQRDANPTD